MTVLFIQAFRLLSFSVHTCADESNELVSIIIIDGDMKATIMFVIVASKELVIN